MTNPFIEQARSDYEGTPNRIAAFYDNYGEHHVVIEMKAKGFIYYLDWIGGEFAPEPDECDTPPSLHMNWESIPTQKSGVRA